MMEEMRRMGTYGFNDGLLAGISIGLPPLLHFGTEELFNRIAVPVLLGQKRICLAISDPMAGSDVAGMIATATTEPDGSYKVNGLKKWITNGTFADFFTTAVRTQSPGKNGKAQAGVSLVVVERSEGVTTSTIKTSSSTAAGTALVVFENAPVQRSNLIGREGHGFAYVMANFNNERWGMCVAGNRHARLILEECFKWAAQRKVFGKPLVEQPVIRNKLAHMAAEVETVQSWLESITYQMCRMSQKEQTEKLAGPIALLKLKQTRAATLVSDEACQIFGGRALTRTGMGQQVERFQRTFKFHSILGGSEEIMADLGVRQALKYWDKQSKL
jgi:alkylation response protein AidB-like acyl-CoA dehydrogenase